MIDQDCKTQTLAWSELKLTTSSYVYTVQKSHYAPGNHHASHF